MNYDPNGVESKRLRQEREVAAVVANLEAVLGRFRGCLTKRRALREELAERLRKVSQRRKETVAALKEMVKRNDRIKRQLEADRETVGRLKRDEAVLQGRYVELLSGRLPTDVDDLVMGEGDVADLFARKEEFLGKVKGAFDELDRQIGGIEGRRIELDARIASAEAELTGADKRRDLMFKKLDIYKKETADAERRLSETVAEEEGALQEYADFIRRLKRVLTLPATVRTLLDECAASTSAAGVASDRK
jgi:chromosome segregation ATPase